MTLNPYPAHTDLSQSPVELTRSPAREAPRRVVMGLHFIRVQHHTEVDSRQNEQHQNLRETCTIYNNTYTCGNSRTLVEDRHELYHVNQNAQQVIAIIETLGSVARIIRPC